MIIRWVKARGWPWHTELEVRDDNGRILACDRADLDQLRRPRVSRAHEALERLQGEQVLLQLHYASRDDVRLELDRDDELQLQELVERYELPASMLDFAQWPELQRQLRQLGGEQLWRLVADWYDEYQSGASAGQSSAEPPHWLALAHPQRAGYWTWLAGQVGAASAWDYFCAHHRDLSLAHLTLYDLLHYELAMATEFQGRPDVDLSHLGL
jgi:hypothetical protein